MSSSTRPVQSGDIIARLSGALAGEFRLEKELGRGGMGVVYLATDLRLDRQVAIKVLLDERPPDAHPRFINEARIAARLAHPNIVPVFSADEAGGVAYFTMAFVEGESVGDMLASGSEIGLGDTLRILVAAANALGYAHRRGVVHRDVKPENILIEKETGRILLTDFGIAQTISTGSFSPRRTDPTVLMGTVAYMSPEQAGGDELDGRSDLYSLGVVAYRILTGRLPFEGHPGAVLIAHAIKTPPQAAAVAPWIPPAVAQVIDRCLSKDPRHRFNTGEALAAALVHAVHGEPATYDFESFVALRPSPGKAHTSGAIGNNVTDANKDEAEPTRDAVVMPTFPAPTSRIVAGVVSTLPSAIRGLQVAAVEYSRESLHPTVLAKGSGRNGAEATPVRRPRLQPDLSGRPLRVVMTHDTTPRDTGVAATVAGEETPTTPSSQFVGIATRPLIGGGLAAFLNRILTQAEGIAAFVLFGVSAVVRSTARLWRFRRIRQQPTREPGESLPGAERSAEVMNPQSVPTPLRPDALPDSEKSQVPGRQALPH